MKSFSFNSRHAKISGRNSQRRACPDQHLTHHATSRAFSLRFPGLTCGSNLLVSALGDHGSCRDWRNGDGIWQLLFLDVGLLKAHLLCNFMQFHSVNVRDCQCALQTSIEISITLSVSLSGWHCAWGMLESSGSCPKVCRRRFPWKAPPSVSARAFACQLWDFSRLSVSAQAYLRDLQLCQYPWCQLSFWSWKLVHHSSEILQIEKKFWHQTKLDQINHLSVILCWRKTCKNFLHLCLLCLLHKEWMWGTAARASEVCQHVTYRM